MTVSPYLKKLAGIRDLDTPDVSIEKAKTNRVIGSLTTPDTTRYMKGQAKNIISGILLNHESGTELNEIETEALSTILSDVWGMDRDMVRADLPNLLETYIPGFKVNNNWLQELGEYASTWADSKKMSFYQFMMNSMNPESAAYKEYARRSDELELAIAKKQKTFKNFGKVGTSILEAVPTTMQLLEQMGIIVLSALTGGALGGMAGSGALISAEGTLAAGGAGTMLAGSTGAAQAAGMITGAAVGQQLNLLHMDIIEAGGMAREMRKMVNEDGSPVFTNDQIAAASLIYAAGIHLIEGYTDVLVDPIVKGMGMSKVSNAMKSLLPDNWMGRIATYLADSVGQSAQEAAEGAWGSFVKDYAADLARYLNSNGVSADDSSKAQRYITNAAQAAWEDFSQSMGSFTIGGIPSALISNRFGINRMYYNPEEVSQKARQDAENNFRGYGKTVDIWSIDVMDATGANFEEEQTKHRVIPTVTSNETGLRIPVLQEDRNYLAWAREKGIEGVKIVDIDSSDFNSRDFSRNLQVSENELEPNTEVTDSEKTPDTDIPKVVRERFDPDRGNAVAREFEDVLRDDGADVLGTEKGTVYVNSKDAMESAKDAADAYGLFYEPTENGIRIYGGGGDTAFTFTVKMSTPETRITDNKYIPLAERDTSKLSDVEYKREQAIEYAFNSIKSQLGDVKDSIVHGGAIQTNILSETMGVPVDEILDKGIVMFQTAKNDDIESYVRGYNEAHPEEQITKDDIKGWMTPGTVTDETGKKKEIYVVNVTNTADETTLLHEVGHVMRAMATPEMLAGFVGLEGFTGEAGAMWRSDIREENGKYYLGDREFNSKKEAVEAIRGNEELFVDLLLEYEKTGNVPNTEVKNFFDKVIDFLKKVYRYIQGNLSKEAKAAFDTFFSTKTFEQLNETENMSNKEWREWNRQMDQRINDDLASEDTPVFQIGERLLAPNGKPSNLSPRLWDIVRTPAFKAWFGDWENDPQNASKIVDENGEPKPVYHWTGNKFDVFDMSKARQSMDIVGAFFSESPTDTAEYAGWSGDPSELSELIEGGYRIAAFLNIKNPAINPLWNYGVTDTAGLDERNKLISEGYDGVINKYEDEPAEYIAFNPNQIKSIDNSGAFSPDNDSILFQSENFKNWFKDSKVVDENGNPLKVYHGTITPGFTQFDTEGKANGGEGNLKFFTDKAEIASEFAMETRPLSAFTAVPTDNAGGVYPVYLSMQNPLDFRSLTDDQIKTIAKAGVERYALDAESIEKNIREAIKYNNDQLAKFYAAPLLERLSEFGYDGMIARMGYFNGIEDAVEYAVVNNNQIKSVFNNGDFSLDNDSILFQAMEKAKNPVFETEKEMKEWAMNAPTTRVDGIKVIRGLKGRNKPLEKAVLMAKIFNGLFKRDLTLLPNYMTIKENQKDNQNGGTKSSDSINAVLDGRTLDFKFVIGSTLKAISRVFEGLKQGDDVFVIISNKDQTIPTLEQMQNSKKSQKQIREGNHYAIILDANKLDICAFEIKKETGKPASLKTQRLNEEVRSRTRQLNGSIFSQIVKAGNKTSEAYSLDEGGPVLQAAYHGTSANFDRFLNEFIGSGEGAQAFGYGHYVSGSDKIGKIYAKQDQRRKGGMFHNSSYGATVIQSLKNKIREIEHIIPLLDQIPDSVIHYELYLKTQDIVNAEVNKGNIDSNRFVKNYLTGTMFQTKKDLMKFLQNTLKDCKIDLEDSEKKFKFGVKRNLYKVEIPDENDGIHTYIDWNKDVDDSLFDKIIDTLSERYSEAGITEEFIMHEFESGNIYTGGELYERLARFFELVDDWYENNRDHSENPIGDEFNYQKLASEFLSEMGVTGFKYRAGQVGGAPRGAENAYNYVIFNPDDIVITNHWTYETDEEADAFFQLSARKLAEFQTRRSELIQPYKDQIQRAIEVNEYVADEYIEYFKDEQWAADELLLRSILKKHPESAAEARKYDSADEWLATMENIPEHLIPRYRRIYDLAHMMTPEQEDRIFLLNWTSSDASVLKLANLLRSYRTKASERQQRATGNTVTGQFGAYKGVSTKLLRLRDRNGVTSSGREYERSTHEEIEEVKKLIQANPRAYREAYLKAYGANDYAHHDQQYFDYGVENLNYRLDQLFGKIDAEQAKAEHRQDLIDAGNTAQLTIEDLQDRIERANEDLKDLKVESGATIKDLKEKLEKVNNDYKSAEYWRRENARKLDEARKQNTQNERELKEKNERIESLNKRLSESREKANNLKAERDKAERAANALQRKVDLMEERDKRIKTMKDIVKMMKFNFDTIDASFEDMFAWVRNLFDYDKAERDELYARRRELLRMLDTESIDSGTRDKIQAELEEVRQEINASELVEIPEGLRVYFATEIGNDTGYIFDKMMYRDNRQSKWSQEELDFILNRVQIMKQDAQAMLESKKLARSSRLSQEAAAFFRQTYNQDVQSFIKEDVTQFKAYDDEHTEWNDNFKWLTKIANATPGRLARQIDGNREGVAYNRFIRKAWNAMFQERKYLNQRTEAGRKKFKELNLSASKLNKKGYTYTKDNGTKVDLTRGQMIGVYVYGQSELGIEKLCSKWGNGITPDEVRTIASKLTAEEKAWGDFLLYEMGSQYERIADVFYNVYNQKLGQRDAYFPLVASGKIVEGNGDILTGPQGTTVRYTDKGFTKAVNPYAIYALNLDVTDTWLQQVQRQEHFMAYAEWARDTNYLLGRGGLGDTIKQKFGKDTVDNLQHYTNFIGSPQNKLTKSDRIMNSLLGRYGASKVIGNTSAMLKQLPTLAGALKGDVDVRYFFKSIISPKASLQAFLEANNLLDPDSDGYEFWKDFIYDNDPQMKNRRLGGTFLGDLNDTSLSQYDNIRNKVTDEISKWTLGLTDGFVTQRLWLACYMTTYEKLKDKMSPEAAHEEARFQASRLISETQNTSLRMDLSQNLREAAEGNTWRKMVFMFGSATMNIFNQIRYDIPYFWNNNQKKRAIATILNVVINMASMMAIGGAFFRKKDEDDEEYAKRIATEVMMQAITNTIPGYGSIIANSYQGFSGTNTMSAFEDVGKTIKKVSNGNMWGALADIVESLAGATGLPANAMEKVYKSIANNNPGYLINKSWADWYEENVK